MPKNMPYVPTLQQHDLNLFHSVSRFKLKSSVTLKVMITAHKYLSLKPIVTRFVL